MSEVRLRVTSEQRKDLKKDWSFRVSGSEDLRILRLEGYFFQRRARLCHKELPQMPARVILCLHGSYQLVLPDTWPQNLHTHYQQCQREI